MMAEPDRHAAYVERRKRITAAQRRLNVALAGDDEIAASVRRGWRPMEQFLREGPNIGHADDPDEPDLANVPRFN